jgi:hypothetical protein
MRPFTVFPLAALAVVACLAACGASVDPAMQASIDRQVAALTPSTAVYPAPTTNVPMPLATGQWTRLKLVDKDGRPSFSTYKIVGQVGDAVWLEVVHEQYSGRTVVKMLVAYGDRTDPNQVDIRRIIAKLKDRDPIDYQEPLLSIVRGTYKSIAKGIVVRWEGLPQETRKVPAGTFTDAYKADSEVSIWGFTTRARSWFHTAVPVQGLVHSDGEDGSAIELVAFGLTGATSEL